MEKKNNTLIIGFLITLLVYFAYITSIYYIAGDQFKYRDSPGNITLVQATKPVGEITDQLEIKQVFLSKINTIEEFSLMFATYNRKNIGNIRVSIFDEENQKALYAKDVDVSTLKDNSVLTFKIPNPIKNVSDRKLSIVITSDNKDKANAVTVYFNDKIKLKDSQLLFNNKLQNGTLSFSVSGIEPISFGKYYFVFMPLIGLAMALYFLNLYMKAKFKKKSMGLNLIYAFKKYRFLVNQLVSRDFKSKYKRSILGVIWSFLNPLVTMTVQYIVFSNLFRFDIDNYTVYLLTGVVFFNFFNEATNQSMNSIVGNSALITKVYVPKFIYPISKVLSSTINLLLSIIPLVAVLIITGVKFTPSYILLPLGFLFIIIFSLGIGFILSSIMVFFRDTQFLWGIIVMLWMYLTPIFYPETILPDGLKFIMDANPLYHFIKFIRIIIMQGISPEPNLYLTCLLYSFITLIIGSLFFKKTQDKFVINM
ncbi:ABC transporter permease [Paenibacillus macerans]|uniref:ABC transporter permease n=1 Tax=Paenibacillus macerans TaxID=44252 RepID=UPI002E1DBB86|nr:ABC transporter permease [Paenibacillus macerans]